MSSVYGSLSLQTCRKRSFASGIYALEPDTTPAGFTTPQMKDCHGYIGDGVTSVAKTSRSMPNNNGSCRGEDTRIYFRMKCGDDTDEYTVLDTVIKLLLHDNFAPFVSDVVMEQALNIARRLYHEADWGTNALEYVNEVYNHNEKSYTNAGVHFIRKGLLVYTGVACAMIAIKSMPEGALRVDSELISRRKDAMDWGENENVVVCLMEWAVFRALRYNIRTDELLYRYCEEFNIFRFFEGKAQLDYLHSLVVSSYFVNPLDMGDPVGVYMLKDRRFVLLACVYLVVFEFDTSRAHPSKILTLTSGTTQQSVHVHGYSYMIKVAQFIDPEISVHDTGNLETIMKIAKGLFTIRKNIKGWWVD